jgi:hypothetical protein
LQCPPPTNSSDEISDDDGGNFIVCGGRFRAIAEKKSR